MDILNMSLASAVLIAAIAIIRAVSLYKLPKKTFLVLWGIVICRLLIPFSIPFRFSLYTGLDFLRQAAAPQVPAAAPAVFAGASSGMPAAGAADTVNIGRISDIGASALSISPLALIWLTGLCILAVFFTVSYFRYVREFKTALPVDNSIISAWQLKHPLRRPVRIRQSDRISAPLTYGVFRPVLLVPKSMDWTDSAKVQYILAHEYAHIRRFDALMKLLLTAALCIHWFNPFVWVMYALANRDIELTCDEAVIRMFGEPAKSAYALTLIGLEEEKSLRTPLLSSFSKNAIEGRIRAIMKTKKYSIPAVIAAILIVVAVTVIFITSKMSAADNAGTQDDTAAAATLSPSSGYAPETAATGQDSHASAPVSSASLEPSPVGTAETPAVTDSQAPVSEAPPAEQIVSAEGWVWPVPDCVIVTSKFGMRYHPIKQEYIFTDHIGIAADEGMAVSAALDGTVAEAGFDSEQGNYIVLDHDNDIQTIYSHLSEIQIGAGDKVSAGDTIGLVGSTGNATGPFLAFGVRKNNGSVNPMSFYKDLDLGKI